MRTKPTPPTKPAKAREFDGSPDRRPLITEQYRKAEAQMRKQGRKLKARVAKTEMDDQRLLHELQVHQVEL